MTVLTALGLAVGFLLGAVPFGVLVGRARGIDVRKSGSGNIGAANVARTAGKLAGALTLALDAGKGALAVAVMTMAPNAPRWAIYAAGLAAVLGHCYSPWLRFRGGKGVATALGVLLAIDPLAGGASLLVFAVAFAATRLVSVGSLAAAVALPIAVLALGRPRAELAWCAAVLALVAVRHKDNLARLVAGTENRL